MDTSQPQTNHGTQTLSDNLTTSQRRPMKKALSIAIQYHELSLYWEEPALELPNAHKDLAVIRELLTDRYGYEYENIRTLWDNPEDETRSSWPTMANIMSAIKWLVEDTESGDHLIFHFSGHGSQQPAVNDKSEKDGMDELIWPCDVVCKVEEDDEGADVRFITALEAYILDDTLKVELVDALPPGVRLTAIFDSCHSGTTLDLLCEYSLASPISPSKSKFHYERLFEPKRRKGKAGAAGKVSRDGKRLVFRAPIVAGPMHLTYDTRLEENDVVDAQKHHDASFTGHKEGRNDKSTLITAWAACLDEQIELESNNGGMLVKNLSRILRHKRDNGALPTNGDILQDLTHVLRHKVNESKTKLRGRIKDAENSDDSDKVAALKVQLEHLERAKPKPVFSCMVEPEERLKEPFML